MKDEIDEKFKAAISDYKLFLSSIPEPFINTFWHVASSMYYFAKNNLHNYDRAPD